MFMSLFSLIAGAFFSLFYAWPIMLLMILTLPVMAASTIAFVRIELDMSGGGDSFA